jgi:hypothetical protein
VTTRRFLIGGGGTCDLRLGGNAIPALHSIIHRDGQDVWLDVLVNVPPLKVNGREVESARLRNGDVIEIGEFQLGVSLVSDGSDLDARIEAAAAAVDDATLEVGGRTLTELSAEELVDLIDQEEELVSQFERGRRLGAEALLHAVLNRAVADEHEQNRIPQAIPLRRPAEPESLPLDEQPLVGELERILVQLQDFSQELERRARTMLQREATYADASGMLLDAQQQLAARLDVLLARLQAEFRRKETPTRASA